MLDFYMFYQLARDPLQLMARKLVCQGLTIATNGRHQCPHASRNSNAEHS
jgi:hypothetical protein